MAVLANENFAFTKDNDYILEDKEVFVSNLFWLLKQTSAGENVENMELIDEDTVEATFKGGAKRHANIAMDSYKAIIKDVIKQIIE